LAAVYTEWVALQLVPEKDEDDDVVKVFLALERTARGVHPPTDMMQPPLPFPFSIICICISPFNRGLGVLFPEKFWC